MVKQEVLVATGDEQRPLIRLDQLSDELFGVRGTPRRDRMERYQQHLSRRRRRVEHLTKWLLRLPLRWAYASDKIDGKTIKFYHGIGHIAYVFWYDVVEDLDEIAYRLARRPRQPYDWGRRVRWAIYSTLDGMAFHYLDDAYIPTLTDVRNRVAGRRQAAWRLRHAQAVAAAHEVWLELEPALKQRDEESRP